MFLLKLLRALSLQAVLRALYAYFADRPLKEIPHIEVIFTLYCICPILSLQFLSLILIFFFQIPLHTIIEIQMGVIGVQEKRYKLMD